MTQPDLTPPVNPLVPVPDVGPEKTFTQEDLNSFLADDRRKTQARYADYNDLKAKATKFDEIEAQNATELDKAVKKADADARADMSTKTNTRLVRAEVKAAASAARFYDPADAAVLLQGRFSDIKVTDDGDVDEAAVKAIVEQLAKDKPHLVKSDNGRPQPLPGQGQNQLPPSTGSAQGKAEALKRFGPKTT